MERSDSRERTQEGGSITRCVIFVQGRWGTVLRRAITYLLCNPQPINQPDDQPTDEPAERIFLRLEGSVKAPS